MSTGSDDPGRSTEVKTYTKPPVSFKQLLSDGYQYNPEAYCLIRNVYCLSSVEGYLPRSNMSYVYDAEDRLMYVMGGYVTDEQAEMITKEDIHKQMVIHVMNVDSHQWITLPSKEYPISHNLEDPAKRKRVLFRNAFVQRYGHRSAMYDRKIYIYGGATRPQEGKLSDLSHVECFDLETKCWSIPEIHGYLPHVTMCHASAYNGSDWYIHGGFLCGVYMGQFSNSLYHFDMKTNTISMVLTVESEELMKDMYMDCHSMVYMGDCLYIFGGRLKGNFQVSNRLSNRLYCFNLKSKKWSQVHIQGLCPEARRGHTATPYKQYMIVFGGCNMGTLEHFNDCHFFDTSIYQWFRINILGLRARPRRSHGCVLIDDSLIIFGGTAPKFKAKCNNDLLKLSFNGSQDDALDDISDTVIIEIFPKLKQRCIHVIIDHKLDFKRHLPRHMVWTVEEFIASMRQETHYVYGPVSSPPATPQTETIV